MDARPMTEVERQRQRAMVIAQEIATGLDDPNVTGPQFLAFMKSCVTTDDVSFMAEALLASAASAQAMREALEELLRVRDWAIKAGGTEGPLPHDVILKFAEMQSAAVDAAVAAIEKATKP